jgi:hypothetical protein
MSVEVKSALTLQNLLKEWNGTNPRFASIDPEAGVRVFDTWLLNPPALPSAEGIPAPPRASLHINKAAADPLRRAARKFVVETAIPDYKIKVFKDYEVYRTKSSFDVCNEHSLLGYIVNHSTPVNPADTAPRIAQINNTDLPVSLARLVHDIIACPTVYDLGAASLLAAETQLRDHLSVANVPAFQAQDQFAKSKRCAIVPLPAQIGNPNPGKSSATRSRVGAIRSAHCDNDKVLGDHPMYTFVPASGPSRSNLYYLWIELFTGFDANQTENAGTGWPALEVVKKNPKKNIENEYRIAAPRISYVEYTAGIGGSDVNTPQARLVWDYTGMKGMFLSFHYVQKQHEEYCNFHFVKQFFMINNNGPGGKTSPMA